MLLAATSAQGRLSILMVAENISTRLSGETIVPWYYLRHLTALGHDVHVLCHARVREHLRADMDAAMFSRVTFLEDKFLQRLLYRAGGFFPHRIEDLIFNQLIQLVTQLNMRGIARRIVAKHAIDVVFQPAPIAAKAVSFLDRVGAPVVIGPMSGGMELPPAFRHMDGPLVHVAIRAARAASALLHRLVPGKLHAAALIVANERTRRALPKGAHGRVYGVMESAVDLARWPVRDCEPASPCVSFIFCGRFVDWKGIQYLVRAFAPLAREGGVRLDLVGDGELLGAVRQQIDAEGIADSVILHGRLPLEGYIALLQDAGVFVSPSLRECGGIAMMEAMAVGVPVIAVNWGGGAQYANRDCAILVEPGSEDLLVQGMTAAMRRLAFSAPLRRSLGLRGRRHLEESGLSWERKTEQVVKILAEVASTGAQSGPSAAPQLQPLRS